VLAQQGAERGAIPRLSALALLALRFEVRTRHRHAPHDTRMRVSRHDLSPRRPTHHVTRCVLSPNHRPRERVERTEGRRGQRHSSGDEVRMHAIQTSVPAGPYGWTEHERDMSDCLQNDRGRISQNPLIAWRALPVYPSP
jgi:hypothetical protein